MRACAKNGLGIGYDGAAYATTGGWLHAFDPFTGAAFLSLELGKDESFPRPPTATNVAIFLAGEHNAIRSANGKPNGVWHAIYAIDPVVQDIAWVAETLGQPTTPPVVGEAWGFVLVGTDSAYVRLKLTVSEMGYPARSISRCCAGTV